MLDNIFNRKYKKTLQLLNEDIAHYEKLTKHYISAMSKTDNADTYNNYQELYEHYSAGLSALKGLRADIMTYVE